MNRQRVVLVFVFLLGMLAGAVVQRIALRFWRPGPPDPDRIVAHMTRELDLDDAQRAQLLALLKEETPKIDRFHQEAQKQFDALREDMDARTVAILRPDQKVKFAAMMARMRHRFQMLGPGGPPLPP